MKNYDWLKSLKAGDPVIVSGSHSDRVSVVEKITPKGAIRVDGDLYDAGYGAIKSSDVWRRGSLEEATEEAVKRVREKAVVTKAKQAMRDFRGELAYDQAVAILQILQGEK